MSKLTEDERSELCRLRAMEKRLDVLADRLDHADHDILRQFAGVLRTEMKGT